MSGRGKAKDDAGTVVRLLDPAGLNETATSTIPGTAPVAVSVIAQLSPGNSPSRVIDEGVVAPAGSVKELDTDSHCTLIVTSPRRAAPAPVTSFATVRKPGAAV